MIRPTAVAVALLALTACDRGASRGPAWPASAGTVAPDDSVDDGGESLEPRASSRPVAALEVAPDLTPTATATAAPGAAADPKVDKPAPTSTEKTPPMVETIELQVEDIQIGPGDIIITP
jgi:hypothetical protein